MARACVFGTSRGFTLCVGVSGRGSAVFLILALIGLLLVRALAKGSSLCDWLSEFGLFGFGGMHWGAAWTSVITYVCILKRRPVAAAP
jgi:hypothetical protein